MREELDRLLRELEEAEAALAERDRADRRVARTRSLTGQAEQALVAARKRQAAEDEDVRAVTSFSPTRIMAGLRGRRQTDLTREQAEAEAAAYAVSLADDALGALQREQRAAERALSELPADQLTSRRLAALDAIERLHVSMEAPCSGELNQISRRSAELRAQEKELREALDAAHGVLQTVHAALAELQEAIRLADRDLLWNGPFTDRDKYAHLDRAQAHLLESNRRLQWLDRELADLHLQAPVAALTVDGLTRTVDVWFDNVFTDTAVRNRIENGYRSSYAAFGAVDQLRVHLETVHVGMVDEMTRLWERREALLRG